MPPLSVVMAFLKKSKAELSYSYGNRIIYLKKGIYYIRFPGYFGVYYPEHAITSSMFET